MRTFHHVLVALALCSPVLGAQQEPPRRLEFPADTTKTATDSTRPSRDTVGVRGQTSRELRNRFVRDQTALGFAVYAPAFALMVGDDGVTGAAGYLVMAGGTFFAAAEVTRRVNITDARHILSSAMALRGAGSALLIAGQSGMQTSPTAAVALIGGLAGTTTGLLLGGGLTAGEAAATVFGHDFAALTAFAITASGDSDPFNDAGVDKTTAAVAWTAAGIGGYFAGHWYARHAKHNVTVGDVQALWLGSSIGVLGAGAVIASSSPSGATTALTLLGGGWLGTFAAERLLVRRYDHSRGDGNLLALGGTAGALMGMGIGILVSGEADRGASATLGFATVGAIGGVAMAERYLQPERDAGRLALLERLSISPTALVAAASRQPGQHALVRFIF